MIKFSYNSSKFFYSLFSAFFIVIVFSIGSSYAYKESDLKDLYDQLKENQPIRCIKYNLENAKLDGLNLRKANFSHAQLKGASFVGTKLSKANFYLANLRGVDFTNAYVEGANFKQAHLLDIIYTGIKAKGTLLADERSLERKIKFEKFIEESEEKLEKNQAYKPLLKLSLSSEKLVFYCCGLVMSPLNFSHSSMILDFRNFKFKKPEKFSLIKDLLSYFHSSYFKVFVKEAVSICDNEALLVVFPLQNNNQNDVVLKENLFSKQQLDLHGPATLNVKFQEIDTFIKEAYERQYPYVEIISGRGIHNSKGDMGVLWKTCFNYLREKKFSMYMCKESIVSINKQGGWRIALRKKEQGRYPVIKKHRAQRNSSLQKTKNSFQGLEKIKMIPASNYNLRKQHNPPSHIRVLEQPLKILPTSLLLSDSKKSLAPEKAVHSQKNKIVNASSENIKITHKAKNRQQGRPKYEGTSAKTLLKHKKKQRQVNMG